MLINSTERAWQADKSLKIPFQDWTSQVCYLPPTESHVAIPSSVMEALIDWRL